MADLSVSDLSDSDVDAGVPESQHARQNNSSIRSGPGRRFGTFGGAMFRQWSKEESAREAQSQHQRGSIEYARQIRSQKAAEKRKVKESIAESGLNPSGASSLSVLEAFGPRECFAAASSNGLHIDLQNALLQCHNNHQRALNRGTGQAVDLQDNLTKHHLQGSMQSLSFSAFERLVGDSGICIDGICMSTVEYLFAATYQGRPPVQTFDDPSSFAV